MSQPSPDIYHTRVSCGLALAWVNSYSAVVVKTPGATLLFDPVSLDLPQDSPIDLIGITHEHSDHWDPLLVADLQRRTGAVVATTPFLASQLASLPDASVRSMRPGDRLPVGDVTLAALRSDHAARQPLAFLVQTADGLTVYLPGDTTPFQEMAYLRESLPGAGPRSLEAQCASHFERPGQAVPSPSMGEGEDGGDTPHLSPPPQGGRKFMSKSCRAGSSLDGRQPAAGVDVLLWMGTSLYDGAKIAQLVQPAALVTYAVSPPAAGERARRILTCRMPEMRFHALERHQVFVYPPLARTVKTDG